LRERKEAQRGEATGQGHTVLGQDWNSGFPGPGQGSIPRIWHPHPRESTEVAPGERSRDQRTAATRWAAGPGHQPPAGSPGDTGGGVTRQRRGVGSTCTPPHQRPTWGAPREAGGEDWGCRAPASAGERGTALTPVSTLPAFQAGCPAATPYSAPSDL
jgi:hypothetical protein